MNKKFFAFMLVIAFFVLGNQAYAEEDFSTKDVLKKEKNSEVKTALEEALNDLGIVENELNQEGNFYFDDNQNIVLQEKKENKNLKSGIDEKKIEKIEKHLEKKLKKDVRKEYVNFSYEDLVTLQDEITSYLNQVPNLPYYELALDVVDNNLKLTISAVEEKIKTDLLKNYGDVLEIKIDANVEKKNASVLESIPLRDRDYNKLGAGIGIRNGNGSGCTMAGIATKGTKNFIITAGHCLDTATMYQMYKSVGRVHLNSITSGFDFGLIEVTGTSLSRFATNGLLVNQLVNYDYDSKLSGSQTQRYNDFLCRVGLTSEKSCGYVKEVRLSLSGSIVMKVTNSNGSDISSPGDSGGPWYTASAPHYLVGVHKGSLTQNPDTAVVTPWVEVRDKYGLNLYTSTTVKPLN